MDGVTVHLSSLTMAWIILHTWRQNVQVQRQPTWPTHAVVQVDFSLKKSWFDPRSSHAGFVVIDGTLWSPSTSFSPYHYQYTGAPYTYFAHLSPKLCTVMSTVTRPRSGRSWVPIQISARHLSFLCNFQTSSGAHPAHYSVGFHSRTEAANS